MTRWKPDAQGRLQQAAFELFGERGYEQTTVEEIAARAGLTKRTFFRYFADKREVFFSGSALFQATIVDAVRAAPAELPPMEAVRFGLVAVAPLFDHRRDAVRSRQTIVEANPDLLEREQAKFAATARAVAEVLRERGVSEPAATLAAETGMLVMRTAFGRWMSNSAPLGLAEAVQDALADLRTLAAA